MNDELFMSVKQTFMSVLLGDDMRSKIEDQLHFDETGTKVFLDNLAKYMPELFVDKEMIIELVEAAGTVSYWMSDEDEPSCCDYYLERLFSIYLDDSLKDDKDVVKAFLEAMDQSELNIKKLESSYEVESVCFEVSHELLMDEDIYPMVLDKMGPVAVYEDVLNERERLDDDIIYGLLKWYATHRDIFMNPSMREKYVGNLGSLHRLWVECLEDNYKYNEPAVEIRYNGPAYEVSEFLNFVDEFLERIEEGGESYTYREKTANSIIGKKELYAEKLFDIDQEVNEKNDATIYDPGFNFFLRDSFDEILSPYNFQMSLFDELEKSHFGVFELDSDDWVDENEYDEVGCFMNFPEDDDLLPF